MLRTILVTAAFILSGFSHALQVDNFVLLDQLENCKLDIQLSPELIEEGLRYYQTGQSQA